MPTSKEYELVPIKPIRDLQAELKKLQAQISKSNSTPKEFVKVLNASLETQKAAKSLIKKVSEVKDNISNMQSMFQNVGADLEEEENPHPEIVTRLEALESQNTKIIDELSKIQEELRRLSYFKERLPPGLPVVYKRATQ